MVEPMKSQLRLLLLEIIEAHPGIATREIAERFNHGVRHSVYNAIAAAQNDGLIEATWHEQPSRRTRTYRLKDAGAAYIAGARENR